MLCEHYYKTLEQVCTYIVFNWHIMITHACILFPYRLQRVIRIVVMDTLHLQRTRKDSMTSLRSRN